MARVLDLLDQTLNPPKNRPQIGEPPKGQENPSGQPGGEPGSQPGTPSTPGGKPGTPGQSGESGSGQKGPSKGEQASSALRQAAMAQAMAMMAMRAQGQMPGQENGNGQLIPGAGEQGNILDIPTPLVGELPDLKMFKPEDWSKLPPKMAQGLLESLRENNSPEYRTAIESYFQMIAERAKQKKGISP